MNRVISSIEISRNLVLPVYTVRRGSHKQMIAAAPKSSKAQNVDLSSGDRQVVAIKEARSILERSLAIEESILEDDGTEITQTERFEHRKIYWKMARSIKSLSKDVLIVPVDDSDSDTNAEDIVESSAIINLKTSSTNIQNTTRPNSSLQIQFQLIPTSLTRTELRNPYRIVLPNIEVPILPTEDSPFKLSNPDFSVHYSNARETVNTRRGPETVQISGYWKIHKRFISNTVSIRYANSSLYFEYRDNPIVGWKKQVFIASSQLETEISNIRYVPLNSEQQIARSSLQEYFMSSNLNQGLLRFFEDHEKAYCICHSSCRVQDVHITHVECSIGLGGCSGWVHPKCLGIMRAARKQWEGIVCPLCSQYLQATGQSERMANKRIFTKFLFNMKKPVSYSIIDDVVIEECEDEPTIWGMPGTAAAFNPLKPYSIHPAVVVASLASQATSPLLTKTAIVETMEIKESRPLLLDTSITPARSLKKSSSLKASPSIPSILSHQLFAGFIPVAGEIFNRDSSSSANFLNTTESLPLEDTEEDISVSSSKKKRKVIDVDESKYLLQDFDDCVNPAERMRWAFMNDGNTKLIVRVRAGWLTSEYAAQNEVYMSGRSSEINLLGWRTTLTDSYKDALLEKCAKESRIDTQSSREQMKLDPSLNKEVIRHLPAADGGLRSTCISIALVDESFQADCINKELCAFCMTKLSMKGKLGSTVTKKGKAKKARPTARRETVVIGAAAYQIHHSCFLGLTRANLFPDGWSNYIDVRWLYNYPPDNGEETPEFCDICTRGGGMMYYFSLHKSCTSLSSPSINGWLGHLPCIYWLEKSQLLHKSARYNTPNYDDSSLNIENSEGDNSKETETIVWEVLNNILLCIEKREKQGSRSPSDTFGLISRTFDKSFACWRCTICGTQSGLAVRCSAIGCAVRSHFLCASSADWYVFSCGGTGFGILCPLHQPAYHANSVDRLASL